jgi:D-glycero-D-manno-heptose 1,7-bisphosphate phosphatase
MRLVFLDRDGVINRFPGIGNYVTKPSQFKLLPRALKGLKLLTEAGYELHVISNQGCVARKMITKEGLMRMTRKMCRDIEKAGGRLHKVHYCLHRMDDDCACKKPKTLLLERAVKGKKINKREVYFIGDSDVDVQAGPDFGCNTLLVLSGRTKKAGIAKLPVRPDVVKKDLYEAARWIVKKS